MIHSIHLKEISKKSKDKYLLDNMEFLFDYYDGKVSKANDKKRLNKFLNSTGNECVEIYEDSTICCGVSVRPDEGFLLCPACGRQYNCLETNNAYIENVTPVYIRLNHFIKILNQLQGKETFTITHLSEIKEYIRKHRITQLDTPTVKNILRKMKLVSYYDHVSLVRKYLDLPVPVIEPELETKLISLFKQIECQYNNIIPDNRNNFFNYGFILSKLFTLLDRLEYIPYLQKLKGLDKIRESERLFKRIHLRM